MPEWSKASDSSIIRFARVSSVAEIEYPNLVDDAWVLIAFFSNEKTVLVE